MTLANITADTVLTARVYKFFGGYSWANNYEVQAVNDIPDPTFALQELADRLVALERALHLSFIVIDRVVVSTYVPDSQPYNPNALATFSYNQNGQRNVSGDVLPLEACLYVRRVTYFGRNGRLLYRGALAEADVGTNALRGVLTTSAFNSIRNLIDSWANPGLGQRFRFVMASGFPNPTNIRLVYILTPSEKVVYKKVANRYFRRRP